MRGPAAVGLLAALLILACAGPAPAQATRSVAVTFDDLPVADAGEVLQGSSAPSEIARLNDTILAALRRHRAPAIGFVVEATVLAMGQSDARNVLAAWTQDGFSLGNHSYSHADTNGLDLAGVEAEVERGEATIRPLMAQAGQTLRFMRFAMNHTGDTADKRNGIAALLAARGYEPAASTIDSSDYVFEKAYGRAKADGAYEDAARIRSAYLDFTSLQIDYYAGLSRQVLGYEPPQVMLLHLNRINADTIDDILSLFERKNYRFITLAEAQADPVYRQPVRFVTRFGPMWAYRWARDRNVTVDGKLEQEPPQWVVDYPSKPAK